LDKKATKNPVFPLGYELPWISLDLEMVEAGGIEPPSESFQLKASTCLSRNLNLALAISHEQDTIKASLI
jgi:hypothetical protein